MYNIAQRIYIKTDSVIPLPDKYFAMNILLNLTNYNLLS